MLVNCPKSEALPCCTEFEMFFSQRVSSKCVCYNFSYINWFPGKKKKEPCYDPEKFLVYWQNSLSPFSSRVVYPLVCVSHTWSLVLEVQDWLFTDRWKLWMPMVWVHLTDAPFWKSYFFIFFTPSNGGDKNNILQRPILNLHRKKQF